MAEGTNAILAGLNKVAASRYGLLTRQAALDAGLSVNVVDRLVKSRRWTVAAPGVYALGPVLEGRHAKLLSAVLWCGPGAVLSHTTAAELYALDGVPQLQKIHLLRRGHVKRKRNEAMCCHRTKYLPDGDVTEHLGLPTTTVQRTLVSLAEMKKVTNAQLERAILDAIRKKYLTALDLVARISAEKRRHTDGVGRLEAVVAREGILLKIESELEAKVLQLLIDENLRPPESQLDLTDSTGLIGRYDFVYRRERVLVEVDGRRAHEATEQLENDRKKTLRAEAVGYAVLRARHEHLFAPARQQFIARLRRALGEAPLRTGRVWPPSKLDAP